MTPTHSAETCSSDAANIAEFVSFTRTMNVPSQREKSEDTQTLAANIDPRLPVLQSIGKSGCSLIFGGSLLSLALLSFLVFLWAAKGPADGQYAPWVWQMIMLNNWATRAVTLSSLLLRTTTAAQATVCTSFVAAIWVERRSIRLSQVAHVSIARSVNGGPHELVRELLSSRSWRLAIGLESILLVILALVTLGIQFSSTILLADFSNTTLTSLPETITRNVCLSKAQESNLQQISGSQWVLLFQGPNAPFGEAESDMAAKSNESGVSDTRPKRRAFLPFEKPERASLRSFKGPALTSSIQTTCLKPALHATVAFRAYAPGRGNGYLTGNINYQETFASAAIDPSPPTCMEVQNQTICLPTGFNCTIPSVTWSNDIWPTALCIIRAEGVQINDDYFYQEQENIYAPTSFIYLAFASNANFDGESVEDPMLTLGNPFAFGEWNSYQVYTGAFLNISLCFATVNTTMAEVEMSTTTALWEPDFQWNANSSTPSTRMIQTMLGADKPGEDNGDRGILSIHNIERPLPLSTLDAIDASSALYAINRSEYALWRGPVNVLMSYTSDNQSLLTCSTCSMLGWSPPADAAALFELIINDNGQAAQALETFLYMLWERYYYLILPLFDVRGYINVVSSTQSVIPVYWGGLVAILSIVLIDIMCVLALTFLYLLKVRYTRQGNYWYAVSQLLSESTRPILEHHGDLGDHGISQLAHCKDRMVAIRRIKPTGRVECDEV
ncbi:hypothetical protein F4860DRAFT_522518 [Xylaria cubensis]|nr:hypothetical protein F4860DRAFT_522518 [Xylaria cubensis]